MMRKTVPLTLGFLSGSIILAKYFLPGSAFLNVLGTDVVNWRTIVAAFALGLGAVNLLGAHLRKIARREKGWDASVVLLLSLIGFTVIGIVEGTTSPKYQWGFNYLYQPVYSGISSLFAFMIGQVGIGQMLVKSLPSISAWIMAVPNTAGMRGIAIGGALGAIALSLRVLLGLERGYLGGGQ